MIKDTEWDGDWNTLFIYKDGKLFNKYSRSPKALQNQEAGTLRFDNYIGVFVYGKYYWAHKIIWEMHYGPIPDGLQIDHKDCNPTNNEIDNLRLATPSQNSMNRRMQSNNKSGYKGVCWHKQKQKWVAQVAADGKKSKFLGFFTDVEEAYQARCKAVREHYGEFVNFD